MSDLVENGSFDVEAQQSLLVTHAETAGASVMAKRRLVSTILMIRSTTRFIRSLRVNTQSERETKVSDNSVENASFNVEAQQSLLSETRLSGPDGPNNDSTNDARRRLLRTFHTIRSARRFIRLGANNISSSSPTSGGRYSSITNHDQIPSQGSRVIALNTQSSSNAYEQNIELQHIQQRKNIVDIVKKRNLSDLRNIGGVSVVAQALNTDLENGLSINPHASCQCKPSQLHQLLQTISHAFLKSCNNITIFLLTSAAILSFAFGIKEEGMHFGWFNGAVLTSIVLILVLCTTIHESLVEWSRKKMEKKYWHSNGGMKNVLTVREGDFQYVGEVELEVGDIVILRKGDQIPADGLFISGNDDQPLELDDGSMQFTTVDQNNPFVFYGSRVLNGSAKMLVTSTRMDTVWGEMMSQAIERGENKLDFETYLHNLNVCVHITGLLISILILIVLFVRHEAGELDDERRYRPDSKGEPTRMKTITDAIMGIITGTKGTVRVSATLLSVSLIGIMEGVTLGLKTESVIEKCRMISHNGINPLQERCQVLMEKNGNVGRLILHCNGPPEDILSLCSHQYDINGEIQEIDERRKKILDETSSLMQANEGGAIAYACKHVQNSDDQAASVEPNGDLIFLAMISLKDVKIDDTKEAVSTLKEAGIKTILVSGDDVSILETIGQNCGLIAPGSDDHLVVTGEEFKNWSDEEKIEKVDKICIMGNCLPSDKILLIKWLKKKDHIVAFIAQRTIDAPVLKQADIGLTFGTWSSHVARECCDITIWNCNCFTFLVHVIKNGRCFQDNIRKFVQLQLTITISGSLINFTAIVSLGDAPITSVQLFWLNLVIALVGGLALLTGPPTKTTAIESSAKLITNDMWRNIAIQASYQATIFLTLQFKAQDVLATSKDRIKSVIYNGFFLCQLFNIFTARETERKNIFRGLFHNNFWFWAALVIFIICQAVFCLAERVFGDSPGLNLKLWGACLLIGFVSWLFDWAGKCVTNFSDWVVDQCRIWRFNLIRSLFSANEQTLRPFRLLNSSD